MRLRHPCAETVAPATIPAHDLLSHLDRGVDSPTAPWTAEHPLSAPTTTPGPNPTAPSAAEHPFSSPTTTRAPNPTGASAGEHRA
jgi:hypothetical protein